MPVDRRRHWPRYIGALALVMTLSAGATAWGALHALPDVGPAPCPDAHCAPVPAPDPAPPGRPQTILMIGSDQRIARSADGDIGRRSDTIMLARVGGGRPTTLLSIPRDTRVTIPLEDGGQRQGKINEAFGDGGPALTAKVVRNLLGLRINQVVVIDFEAFQRLVNRVGCLYEDVDRSYFNDQTGPGGYAAIDVKSGYQLLCGGDTLDWVRFRHTDSDLVRGARQQAFLRAAKAQIAATQLIDDRAAMAQILRTYVHTSLQSRAQMVGLLKLLVGAAGTGTRSVPFLATDSPEPGSSDLLVTPAGLATMRRQFLAAPASPPGQGTATARPSVSKARRRAPAATSLAPGLQRTAEAPIPPLLKASFDLAGRSLPVYAPAVRLASGGWADRDPTRVYAIKGGRFSGRSYPAYRLTFAAGSDGLVGQYYGVQGTTWKDAPILRTPHHAVRRGGRTLQVYLVGTRAQLVAWQTPRAVYWVSNTLSQCLTTRQLVDIAASLRRVPG